MKTYDKVTTFPRLVIQYDQDSETPRADDNVGLLFTIENRSKSPDGTDHPLYDVMVETGNEAKDTNDHMERMRARASELFQASAPKDGNSHDEDLHIIEIYPVYKYEHGNVVYRRGVAGGFDYSNCGFYVVTAQRQAGTTWTAESTAEAVDAELATYTQWCNGEIYGFTLYDEQGEEIDACWGFYDLEAIRDNLPEDWKDEDLTKYLKTT